MTSIRGVADPWTIAVGEIETRAERQSLAIIERGLGDAKPVDPTTDDRRHEQSYRQLVNAITDYAIYMLDATGAVATWNPGAERFKGYTHDEIVGRNFSIFFTPDDVEAGIPALILRTAREQGRFEGEGWRVRKDGSRIWVEVVVDPIYDEKGEIFGYAKIIRDITQRRQAQAQLDAVRAQLFQAQKLQALGELTGGIAHDFNNLMTIIRGSAELLLTPELAAEKRQRYTQAIVQTADRAISLTSRLLAFGRRQPLQPGVLELPSYLDGVVEMLSRTIGDAVVIRLDVAPDVAHIEVDPGELENALINAAINARDAMPDGGTLTISARNIEADGAVCIAIGDTGTGIDEALIPRVFEPFFTTKRVGKGTGLGLSQIHGFAAQSGGRAEICSVVGAGTTLSIILPVSTKSPMARATPPAAGVRWPGTELLLVEDDHDVRALARTMLEELGFVVTDADCAESALAAARTQSFALVFSDIVMPGMSGLDLARSLRKRDPTQRILLATGYSDQVAAGEATEFPILRKPYCVAALGTSLAALLPAPPAS